MQKIPLSTPLLGIRGISAKFLNQLDKLGLKTVKDLLWHFPSRYEDFSKIYKIAELEPGQHATIQGAVEDVELRRTWKKKITVVEAMIADETGSIRAVWFNQPYVANSLRPGRTANFAGKVSLSEEGDLYLSHPAYELVKRVSGVGYQAPGTKSPTPETRHTARLVPIYPETKGLTSKGIRFLVQSLLKNIEKTTEWIPGDILRENDLPEINSALHKIHFPDSVEEATAAKRRFEFETLFLFQLYNLQQRLKLAREKAPVIKTNIDWMKQIIAELPFVLTVSQKKALWEIIQDVEKPEPMNRLLQGDVGSGKTVIAVLAALAAAGDHGQTAFMAPTEVLARQHFETLKKLFSRVKSASQPATCLITGSEAKIFYETDREEKIKKSELLEKIKNGEVKIVVGTHALIQESVAFNKLDLAVVDEQHRFGVTQRRMLARGKNAEQTQNNAEQSRGGKIVDSARDSASIPQGSAHVPHLLSMSATPIPRTLMMAVFGDLDISLIAELPAGRKEIVTRVVPPKERKDAYDFIRNEVKKGRQAFVICPRIEPSSAQSGAEQTRRNAEGARRGSASAPHRSALLWATRAVKEEYEKLSKKVFPDLRVAMLHGKLKPKEKEKVMKRFGGGESDILVSTSVVEVGVDVPNATIMMVEGADRFGLAQLYQFRGRVGRGEHQSYCFLFTDSEAKSTHERLNAVVKAKNGFELAEQDLKIRGPGEFLGEMQSGMPDYAMRALQDAELVKHSRFSAAKALEGDPELKKLPELKKRLDKFERQIHLE